MSIRARNCLRFGVTVQRGIVAKTVSDAMSAGKELSKSTGSNWYVIKAQPCRWKR